MIYHYQPIWKKHPFNLRRYFFVLIIDLSVLGNMIYFHAENAMYLYMVLQFMVLVLGIVFIKKLPNKTFCKNSEVNITLNLLRRDSFHHCFFFLITGDSIFNLALQFFLLEKATFCNTPFSCLNNDSLCNYHCH